MTLFDRPPRDCDSSSDEVGLVDFLWEFWILRVGLPLVILGLAKLAWTLARSGRPVELTTVLGGATMVLGLGLGAAVIIGTVVWLLMRPVRSE